MVICFIKVFVGVGDFLGFWVVFGSVRGFYEELCWMEGFL